MDPGVNLSPERCSRKMTNDTEESMVSATTDVADAKDLVEEAPEDAEQPQDCDDAGAAEDGGVVVAGDDFDEFLRVVDGGTLIRPSGGAASPTGDGVAQVVDGGNDASEEEGEAKGLVDDVVAPSEEEEAKGSVDDAAPTAAEKEEAVSPDAPSPSRNTDNHDEMATVLTEPLATNDEVGEGQKNDSTDAASEKSRVAPAQAPARRRSSEVRSELHAQKLMCSGKSIDSWGGFEGSLPPLAGQQRHTSPDFPTTSGVLLEGGEGGNTGDLDGRDGSDPELSTPQDNAPARGKSKSDGSSEGREEDDDVANFVNVKALIEPSSNSEYYYSQANRSNRKVLDKVKSSPILAPIKSKKKNNVRGTLDESMHSRVEIITHISHSSAYRGSDNVMRDGSRPKSALKTARGSSGSLLGTVSENDADVGDHSTSSRSMKRCIFSSVDIREHERVAGDNPCVTSGVPLSIGWGYLQHDPISLDDYESNRGPPRDKIEMMVPAAVRRSMLRDEFGVTLSEMNAAMKEVNITKRQRRHTVASEHLEGWSEVAQSAVRKFKRFVKKTSTAKEEQKMWENAHKSTLTEYLKKNGEGSLGKNPEAAGVGAPGVGPRIVPENSANEQAPFLEISFQKGDAPVF